MNNIITLSGNPGSGKSTLRNALKKMYEETKKQWGRTWQQRNGNI